MKKTITLTLLSMFALCAFSSERVEDGNKRSLLARGSKRPALNFNWQEKLSKDPKYQQYLKDEAARIKTVADAMPLSLKTGATSWDKGSTTNESITITVFVGGIPSGLSAVPAFRNLTFDKDGRLIAVSNAIAGKGMTHVKDNPSNLE